MIDLVVWIILIIIAAGLLAYALLSTDTVPYSEIVALVASTLISWVVTVLYATGNIISDTARELVTQTVTGDVTSFAYETFVEYVPIDGTVTALLIAGSVALTLYCLYVLIPTVIDLLNSGSGNND